MLLGQRHCAIGLKVPEFAVRGRLEHFDIGIRRVRERNERGSQPGAEFGEQIHQNGPDR